MEQTSTPHHESNIQWHALVYQVAEEFVDPLCNTYEHNMLGLYGSNA